MAEDDAGADALSGAASLGGFVVEPRSQKMTAPFILARRSGERLRKERLPRPRFASEPSSKPLKVSGPPHEGEFIQNCD
jgi:hypothetical protein